MGEQVRLAKSELRRRVLAARRGRSPELMADVSQAICSQVRRLVAFHRANHVVAYSARPDEVDPSDLVESGLARRRPVYFPRLVGAGLEFVAAAPATLQPGAFGVAEPPLGPRLSAASPGIVFLVPGLAFDGEGVRLGRGGGHYDRALAAYPRALRLGLALDADLVPMVPRNPWDRRVDAVVTEQRLLWAAMRPEAVLKENLE
jgi:5-formyltetrahydrofolate cyclo-ligase